MLSGAVALAIMVGTILYRAVDALDMLVAASVFLTIAHLNDRPFD